MKSIDLFDFWKTEEFFDTVTRNELAALSAEKDIKKIEDRFYRDLEFGTGDLRAVMGAGINRMTNIQWVKPQRVLVIEYFFHTVANVLSSMGVYVYLYEHARPTPQVSFSVRFSE